MKRVISDFKQQYKVLVKKGLVVDGIMEIDGVNHIHISIPFVFDCRKIPGVFKGFRVRRTTSEPLPDEFQIDYSDSFWYKKYYVWAPERFEKFIDRCGIEIMEKLGEGEMSRYEILSALVGADFNSYKREIQDAVEKGELPAYNDV